ncbi:MAG: beta-ketoacyl-ACP synthase [Phyllobacteriaceae bacterium]|nr:beta-ketoacyl-ACP synthase [Phyllobacteriaceae bacterium]
MEDNRVVITGIGVVSALGVGVDAHLAALAAPPESPPVDRNRFAPYCVHPLPEIDWSLQIPKRGDQRQMETWQRLGTFTAGLALQDAGLKDNESLCATMDMIVAAGGGERDTEVDNLILAESLNRNDREVLLNEKLSTDLRPTLFLAQLSNLLAGNISIVHKVTGSSRTFMGEEAAGISAVEYAASRIRAGQSTHALVGGAYNAEHVDMLLNYAAGGYLHRGVVAPVWNRAASDGGGVVTGSGAAFLVLESEAHARERGAPALAILGPVVSGRARRRRDDLAAMLISMARRAAIREGDLTISGASGALEATKAESAALASICPVRAFSTLTGHMKEAQFPFAIALAALAVAHGVTPPSFGSPLESAMHSPPARALATTIGLRHGEGMVMVEKP